MYTAVLYTFHQLYDKNLGSKYSGNIATSWGKHFFDVNYETGCVLTNSRMIRESCVNGIESLTAYV